jgi:hypothetical protein
VWVFGREVQPQAVDAAALDTVEEFADRYGREEAHAVLTRVHISFLAEDTYLLEGRQVAGNASSTGDRVYVGAGTVPLSRSALVHEWVHALDLQRTGDTDDSHASWKERIYPGIARVNARLARREGTAPPR